MTETPFSVDGDEVAVALSSLDRIRRTFGWKCGALGDPLDAAGLAARLGPSTMTLGGLLKHMALVEADWFGVKLRGERPGEPWEAVDWDGDPDWEWRTAADDSPEELYALWHAAVDRARERVAAAIAEADDDLGAAGRFSWPSGATPTIRRIVVDMIEEYARHTGHADLIRESVDGLVGEDMG